MYQEFSQIDWVVYNYDYYIYLNRYFEDSSHSLGRMPGLLYYIQDDWFHTFRKLFYQ